MASQNQLNTDSSTNTLETVQHRTGMHQSIWHDREENKAITLLLGQELLFFLRITKRYTRKQRNEMFRRRYEHYTRNKRKHFKRAPTSRQFIPVSYTHLDVYKRQRRADALFRIVSAWARQVLSLIHI